MTNENKSSYKWYVLGVLTVVYIFNFIDRQVLVILSEPIKADLDLSDSQLGWLTGFAFAIFYVTLGIPIARYADKSNRKNIVASSLIVWSGFTAISGQVQNFFQLVLARIGVGVGEAGCSPPAHAIISDYFPPEKRATALSIYSMGIYLGILLGYTLASKLSALYGWRVAFYAIGIPGVLFALIVFSTVKEPIRGRLDPESKAPKTNPRLAEVLKLLFGKKTFLFIALGSGFNAFVTYGVGNFIPSFMARIHGIDVATIGLFVGVGMGVGGGLGTYLGGFIADRLRSKDLRWYMYIAILGSLLNIVPSLIMIFTSNGNMAMGMVFFTSMFTAFYLGPTIAVTHSLVSPRMRTFSSSVLFFVLNLIGLGCGPVVVGYISDFLEPTYGAESLRYAFLFTMLPGLLTMLFYYLASKNYIPELKAFQDTERLQNPDVLDG